MPPSMNNDILLQDIVVTKRFVTTSENVDARQTRAAEESLPKRTEVRPIAEATGRDRNNLATIIEKISCQRHKCRIHVTRRKPEPTQEHSRCRIRSELSIWRIQNREIEPRTTGREHATIKTLDSERDEILLNHLPLALNPRFSSPSNACAQRYAQLLRYLRIRFNCGDGDLSRSRGSLACVFYPTRSQC